MRHGRSITFTFILFYILGLIVFLPIALLFELIKPSPKRRHF